MSIKRNPSVAMSSLEPLASDTCKRSSPAFNESNNDFDNDTCKRSSPAFNESNNDFEN
eukprot:Awhi_evm2s2513